MIKAVQQEYFFDTFPGVRLKKLADEGSNVLINFTADPNGNLIEISFVFTNNSTLTPVEIEKLETRLKKEVKFTLNSAAFKNYTYIRVYISVNFKMLMNHGANAIYPQE